MIGLYTALLLILMVVNVLATMFIVWVLQGFLAMVWRRVITPPKPPWKRNHIGLNHVRTDADPKNMKIGTLVLQNYRMTI